MNGRVLSVEEINYQKFNALYVETKKRLFEAVEKDENSGKDGKTFVSAC